MPFKRSGVGVNAAQPSRLPRPRAGWPLAHCAWTTPTLRQNDFSLAKQCFRKVALVSEESFLSLLLNPERVPGIFLKLSKVT